MSKYDCIVIGGGHNGLTTATKLAKAGKKVVVLERRDVLGGLAAGEEFHPGYRTAGVLNDTTGVRRKIVEELDLSKHGLKLHSQRPAVLLPAREGDGIVLFGDEAKTAKALAKHSEADSKAYAEYQAFVGKVRKIVRKLLDEVPPDPEEPQFSQIASLLQAAIQLRLLGAKDMMEVLRVFSMCVADWVGEFFEGDLLKAGLSGPGVYGCWLGPWSPGSATNLLLWEIAAEGGVVGGPAALTAALKKAVEAAGGEIRTGAEVERIRIEKGRAIGVTLKGGDELDAKVVAASCDPKTTFLDLIDPAELNPTFDRRIVNFRTRGTTAKVNLALSGPLEFPSAGGEKVAFIRTGEHVDELEKAFDSVKYGEFAKTPALEIYIPTVEDASLAPEGHHVASILVHFAAFDLDAGWDEESAERLGEAVVKTLAEFAPAVEEKIVARQVISPVAFESIYGITGGHIHHGEQAIDQLILRPSPECSQYDTPFEGLYLCGSGSHPGGGITCAPGYLGAQVIASS